MAPSVRERGSARRSGGEREKMILVPMSMLSEGGAPKKLVVAKKRVLASGGCGYEIIVEDQPDSLSIPTTV